MPLSQFVLLVLSVDALLYGGNGRCDRGGVSSDGEVGIQKRIGNRILFRLGCECW